MITERLRTEAENFTASGTLSEPLFLRRSGRDRLAVVTALAERNGYSADAVAALSTDRILALSRTELVDVIGSVRGEHLRPGVRERLPLMDDETLRRLVFLTRRLCRNRQRIEADAFAGTRVNSCK